MQLLCIFFTDIWPPQHIHLVLHTVFSFLQLLLLLFCQSLIASADVAIPLDIHTNILIRHLTTLGSMAIEHLLCLLSQSCGNIGSDVFIDTNPQRKGVLRNPQRETGLAEVLLKQTNMHWLQCTDIYRVVSD